jgi:hypothetical protein
MKFLVKYLLQLFGYKPVKIKNLQEIPNPERLETFGLTKINYGCYRNYIKGWLNVDLNISQSEEFKTAQVNLALRHPFDDETFHYGFAEDFVACLTQGDLIIYLYEVYRTFRKGGVLRISTPGLEGVLKKHFSDLHQSEVITSKIEAYNLSGNVQFPSLSDLTMITRHIGFSDIKIVEFGKSDHLELNNLDTRTDQIGLNTYVEITK